LALLLGTCKKRKPLQTSRVRFVAAKIGNEKQAGFIVNVHYINIFLLLVDFLLFSVHLLKDDKRVAHIAVGGGFVCRQIVMKRRKVLIDCPAESVKNFLFGSVVPIFVGKKRQFAKAIYHSDKIDFEAFFCGKLQVTTDWRGFLFGLFEEFYFSLYDAANVLWIVLFV